MRQPRPILTPQICVWNFLTSPVYGSNRRFRRTISNLLYKQQPGPGVRLSSENSGSSLGSLHGPSHESLLQPLLCSSLRSSQCETKLVETTSHGWNCDMLIKDPYEVIPIHQMMISTVFDARALRFATHSH